MSLNPLPTLLEPDSPGLFDSLKSLQEEVRRLTAEGDVPHDLREILESLTQHAGHVARRLEHESNVNFGLKRSLNRFQVIQHLCETIGRTQDIDLMLQALLRIVPRVLSFSTAAIYLYDAESDTYTLRAQELLSPEHRQMIQTHFEEGIIPWVIAEKRAIVIPHLEEVTEEPEGPIRGFVIVPLLAGDNRVGFMEIWHDNIQEIQGEIHLGILELMARQVAIAIENSLLCQELQQANKLIKKSQAQIITAEKMAAIGVLASGIAHEVNNPLQVIFAKVQLLKRRAHDEKLKSSLESIERESMRISNIVSSILRNARNQNHPQQSPCQLNALLRDVLTIAQSRLSLQNTQVHSDLQPKLPQILGNAGEISQVFSNLIENARQAMPHGGTLTLRSRSRSKTVRVTIRDTGCGISKAHLKRIFEPFFTTKGPQEGTGLGLFLCYQIVERHGGRLEVSSTLGKGTTFTLQFPHIIRRTSSS